MVTEVRETTIRTMCMADIEAVVEIDRLSFSLPWSVSDPRYVKLGVSDHPCVKLEVADPRYV